MHREMLWNDHVIRCEAIGGLAHLVANCPLRGMARPSNPLLDGQPRLILVNDDDDGMKVDPEFVAAALCNILPRAARSAPEHVILWLIDDPTHMAHFLKDVPPNLWLGAHIWDRSRVKTVKQVLALGDSHTKRFVMVDPTISSRTLEAAVASLDWVILDRWDTRYAGGIHRFVRRMSEVCSRAGTPVFSTPAHAFEDLPEPFQFPNFSPLSKRQSRQKEAQ